MLFIKRLSLLFLFCNLSWAINVKTDSPHATLMSFLNSFKHWEGEGQKEVLKTMDLDFLPTSLRSTQGLDRSS